MALDPLEACVLCFWLVVFAVAGSFCAATVRLSRRDLPIERWEKIAGVLSGSKGYKMLGVGPVVAFSVCTVVVVVARTEDLRNGWWEVQRKMAGG